MSPVGRSWSGILLLLVPAVLALAACSSPAGGVDAAATDALQEEPSAVVDATDAARADLPALTVSVYLKESGIEPASLFLPRGRRVRLVVRNHDRTEHHYRIVGLVPQDLLWRDPGAGAEDVDLTDEEAEMASHHETGFLPYRATSRSGIRPFGDEVHGYARGGEFDVVLFTPTNTGTFTVECPLHPEETGKVIVF